VVRFRESPQDPQSIRKNRLGPLRNVCKDKGRIFPKSRQQIPSEAHVVSVRKTDLIKSQHKATGTGEGAFATCHEPTVPSVIAPRSIMLYACEAHSQSPLLRHGVLTCVESTAHKSPLIGKPARSPRSATVVQQPTFSRRKPSCQRRW
jgi:hypothetical protein